MGRASARLHIKLEDPGQLVPRGSWSHACFLWLCVVPWLKSTGPCWTVKECIFLGCEGWWAGQMCPLKHCACEIWTIISANIYCTLDCNLQSVFFKWVDFFIIPIVLLFNITLLAHQLPISWIRRLMYLCAFKYYSFSQNEMSWSKTFLKMAHLVSKSFSILCEK